MNDPLIILAIVIGLTLSGLVGLHCGRTRARGGEGLVLGLIFGPFGWLVVLLAYPYVAPLQPTLASVPLRGGPAGGRRLSDYAPKR